MEQMRKDEAASMAAMYPLRGLWFFFTHPSLWGCVLFCLCITLVLFIVIIGNH